MKISEKWLRTWINPPIDCKELAAQLTQAGLEVEAISQADGDNFIELNITPNRGDCLSIAGIARELAAINRSKLQAPALQEVKSTIPDQIAVTIEAPDACPRYCGRIIRGVNALAKTPNWLAERLQAVGIRSISVLVDISNYVMLELGQPLHAFDLSKITGDIKVRYANANEQLQLLDQQTVKLTPQVVLIADNDKALALAGIMGGLASAVTLETKDVFLESAFFNPSAIAGLARYFGLQSDAAYRFERGVDPELPLQALNRATELILSIAGGEAGVIVEKTSTEHLPTTPIITLRYARIQRILGTLVPEHDVSEILVNLGMQVQPIKDGWQVQVPSWRFDIKQEVDLIEEIARLYGYDNITAQLPIAELSLKQLPNAREKYQAISQLLIDRGYSEAITYSFIAKDRQSLFSNSDNNHDLALSNPLSADLAVMRSSLWPGLLSALNYNLNRQQTRLRLFETGLSFIIRDEDNNKLSQQNTLAGLCTGLVYPEQWGFEKRAVDFFDVKGDVEAILASLSPLDNFTFVPAQHKGLKPGECCAIAYQGKTIGYLGALNTEISSKLEIPQAVYLFEINLEGFADKLPIHYRKLSKFPSIRRDIALLVEQTISYQQIRDNIAKLQDPLVKTVEIFDIYQGKNIKPGYKSIAIALFLQHLDRTLVDEEVNQSVNSIITALMQTIGAELRG
jgi:phenylalanyl-tRNA synthetase beta chain